MSLHHLLGLQRHLPALDRVTTRHARTRERRGAVTPWRCAAGAAVCHRAGVGVLAAPALRTCTRTRGRELDSALRCHNVYPTLRVCMHAPARAALTRVHTSVAIAQEQEATVLTRAAAVRQLPAPRCEVPASLLPAAVGGDITWVRCHHCTCSKWRSMRRTARFQVRSRTTTPAMGPQWRQFRLRRRCPALMGGEAAMAASRPPHPHRRRQAHRCTSSSGSRPCSPTIALRRCTARVAAAACGRPAAGRTTCYSPHQAAASPRCLSQRWQRRRWVRCPRLRQRARAHPHPAAQQHGHECDGRRYRACSSRRRRTPQQI
jgi:hypothetical protein